MDAVYRRVAELHAANLDQGFLSKLGPRFLALLYRSIDESPASALILAREGDQVVGFAAGTLDMGEVYRRLLGHWAALAVALAPSLLVPSRLWRMLETLRFSRGGGAQGPAAALPEAELLSIAVDPGFRGQGHADRLYEGLREFFAQRGCGEFKIIVGAALAPAHRFYRRMGAEPAAEVEVHPGALSIAYVQRL